MSRAKAPPCIIGRFCVVHQFVHGKEAEELRQRIERLLKVFANDTVPASRIQDALDAVDARDSLAYLERRPNRRRQRPVKKAPKKARQP